MTATDFFGIERPDKADPADHAFLVAENDGADLSYATRALYVGGAGAVKVDMLGGETVTFSGVPAGTVLPIRVTKIYATGTTASLMIGLY
jgi:hypothetical protein